MRSEGVDLRVIGLFTLAQAPWSFKFLWSPLLDRFALPVLGRRRGWIALTQVALFALTLLLAGVADRPDAPWLILALAFAIALAGASQDIVYDAYAVDVLRPEEQGIAVGARTALHRAAMFIAGGLAITLAAQYSWAMVCAVLALAYLPMLALTCWAPEPEEKALPPRSLREAVWLPFLGFLGRHRALEILAFVFFYKFGDNLAQALLRPFLNDMGYNAGDRGVGLATVAMVATLFGAFLGGALTPQLGLGRALWIFGFFQIFSNIGYVLIAQTEPQRLLMFSAMGFESFTQGLGTGAFSVFLLRLTQKRFSATQYALFSSLFGLPRVITGPVSGFTVDALGWSNFFWLSMLAAVPGMVLLYRFVPWGVREPEFSVEPPRSRAPLTQAGLIGRGLAGALVAFATGACLKALLDALKALRADPTVGFDGVRTLVSLFSPRRRVPGWSSSAS
jgi:MFS transporter, PAT family, beta-lactamase induction signal transducer AmpG